MAKLVSGKPHSVHKFFPEIGRQSSPNTLKLDLKERAPCIPLQTLPQFARTPLRVGIASSTFRGTISLGKSLDEFCDLECSQHLSHC